MLGTMPFVVRPGRGMAPWGSMYPDAVTGWLMAEIGLPVVEVMEVGIPPEEDGKGVGDSGLIPILSEIEKSK